MRGTARLLLAMVVLLVPALVSAAGPAPMKEGLWEITTRMEMPGMPFQVPPTTVTHCYSKEELKDSTRTIPPQEGECKMTDVKQSGNKISWKVRCTGKNPGRGEGDIVYKSPTAYEGTLKMETEGMTVTSRYKAKRVSDCK